MVVIGLVLIKAAVIIVRYYLKKTNIDKALHKFIINFIKTVMLIILFILFLDRIRVDTKSIVTVLGISGGAIALALKDSLSNIAGGIIILFTKPFQAGDFVDIGGTTGRIKQIDMFITTLITTDNKITTIPNGVVSNSVITNYSRADMRRVDCIFDVPSSTDIIKVKELMHQVAKRTPMVLEKPETFVAVKGNNNGKIQIELKVWSKTEDYDKVVYGLEENVLVAMEKENWDSKL